jgi:hypothetical protein
MRLIPGSALTCTAIALIALSGRGDPPPQPRGDQPGPVTAEQLRKSAGNLERIAIAIHNYHDARGALPTNQLSGDRKPLLSWRVQILAFIERDRPRFPPPVPGTPPVIEYDRLFQAFKLDEPWDSAHNKRLIDRMPEVYAPVRGTAGPGMTFYQAFGGSHGWLKPGARLVASFPDGTSNTLLVAEAARPVVWTKPDDLTFDGKEVPALGGLFDGRFHAAMGDGSVRRFRKGVAAATLRLLIDPADGLPLPADIGLDPEETK